MKYKKTCKVCNKTFYVYKCRINIAKYCSLKCLGIFNSMQPPEKSSNWKGGRVYHSDGYIMVLVNKKYILEHRYIMEKLVNRKLNKGEIVHHIDGNRENNNKNNLKLMSKSYHNKLTMVNNHKNHKMPYKKTKLKRPEINKNTIIPYVKRGYSFGKIAKIFNTYRTFISRRFYS